MQALMGLLFSRFLPVSIFHAVLAVRPFCRPAPLPRSEVAVRKGAVAFLETSAYSRRRPKSGRLLGLRPPATAVIKHRKSVELQLVKCIGPAFPIRLIWTPFAETFFEGRFLEPFNGCDEKKRPKVLRFLRVIFQNREHFCIGPGDSKR